MTADVLIVEHGVAQAGELRRLVEAGGYAVRVAAGPAEALAALRERLPLAIVVGDVTQDLSGSELCALIEAEDDWPDVPVVVLAALADPQDLITSLHRVAADFIRVPDDVQRLLPRVGTVLASRRWRRSRKPDEGTEVSFGGNRCVIGADRHQAVDFLVSTCDHLNAELVEKNAELEARQLELERALGRLEAERERVRELMNVNRAVLDSTEDGIALVSPEGRYLIWNAAFEQLMDQLPGVSSTTMLGRNVEALEALGSDVAVLHDFARLLQSRSEAEMTFELDVPSIPLCLSVFTAPMHDDREGVVGRVVVSRNVTREREAERIKSQLVTTVSHELRTPLTSILGFAELLGAPDLSGEKRVRYADWILSEGRRLSKLLDDFLDLRRVEEGDLCLERERLDLGDVVREETEIARGTSANHTVAVDLPDWPLTVEGDREQLARALANLLSNAIKYSPEGGPVEVGATEHGGQIDVSVEDRGLGVPDDVRDKLFTRFFRVDSSDTRRAGGAGLGLALCREIVEAHGGEVGYESVDGRGSRFWLRLPKAPPVSE